MSLQLLMALAGAAVLGCLVLFVLVRWAGTDAPRYRRLVVLTTVLTFCLVVVGAYVRLSDAGLGCPDWPGCYGHPGVPEQRAPLPAAATGDAVAPGAVVPDAVVPDAAKGWKEMGHRYLASVVGVLILAIVIIALRNRRIPGRGPWLALSLLAVLLVQAALGRWTVTLLLRPAIVSLHLAGGMTTLALLTWLSLRCAAGPRGPAGPARWRFFAALGLVLVAVQILLGGWVSSNYAALACSDLPLCQGALIPPMDLGKGFHVVRELGRTGDGALLPLTALTAIHWVHRVWAMLVLVYCTVFGLLILGRRAVPAAVRPLGGLLLAAAWIQVGLGVGNVLFSLPLAVAAAHNAGAAALLVATLMINFAFTGSGQAGAAAVRGL